MRNIDLYLIEKFKSKEGRAVCYLMVGIPGSGKSTWIKNHLPKDINVISRDKIRAEIGITKDVDNKGVGSHQEEMKVTSIENDYIKKAIKKKETFVIDDTNYRRKDRKKTIQFLRSLGTYVIGVNVETPLETCIKRRAGQIDPEVMTNIAKKFIPVSYDEEVDEIIKVK